MRRVITDSASRAALGSDPSVVDWPWLRSHGFTRHDLAAQVAARRWQRHGNAVVLHNGPLTRLQIVGVGLANAGPRSLVTSFTAGELLGLRGWERPAVHILVPARSHVRAALCGSVRTHYAGDWSSVHPVPGSRVQLLADAVLRAASSFPGPRPGCGLLAAAVQQRLTTAAELRQALVAATRTRNRAAFIAAVEDIGQGSQALSEIDFIRLCRRFGLPKPEQQTVRLEPNGRRRYLDVTWRRDDGRLVVVEVDGAHHMNAGQWESDQLRHNEIAIEAAVVLRFSSVVVRDMPAYVAGQVKRALGG